MRLGAPRRLFTSPQGRTGGGAGLAPDAGGEASRQAGQSVWAAGLQETLERAALGCCQPDRTMMGPAQQTQPRHREQEDTQEQKQEDVMRHTDPHEVKFEGWEALKIP